MKIAVVYYSLEGNTKHVAETIAGQLNAKLFQLRPVRAYPTGPVSKFFWGGKSATFQETPPLEDCGFSTADFDLVVLGTPLWAGTITPPLRSFLRQQSLAEKQVAAFICCSGGSADKAFSVLREEAGCPALLAELRLVNPLKSSAAIVEPIQAFCQKLLAR